jgi:hypothetical protein
MNWSAIAAIAEVVGVLGIVVSIVYLGMQVRQSNSVTEDNSFQGILSLGQASLRAMAESGNREIMMKGLLKYEDLAASDKLVFENLMFALFTTIEAVLLSNDMELLHGQHPEGAGYFIRSRFFPYSGTLSWWQESKELFGPEVQQWMESQINISDTNADFYDIKGSH